MSCPKCGNGYYNYATETCSGCGHHYKQQEAVSVQQSVHPVLQVIAWFGGGLLFLYAFEQLAGFPWPGP